MFTVIRETEVIANRRAVPGELCRCGCGDTFTRSKGSTNELCYGCDHDDYMTDFYDNCTINGKPLSAA